MSHCATKTSRPTLNPIDLYIIGKDKLRSTSDDLEMLTRGIGSSYLILVNRAFPIYFTGSNHPITPASWQASVS